MAADSESARPEVSVIVPFHDSAEYLPRCVEALLAQSYPASYEILMVDNNSTDESAEIIRQYPRVRLLQEQQQGAYVARNTGVASSRGAMLAFTDSDCVASSEWLKELVAPFSDPAVGLVQGRRIFGDDRSALSMLAAYEAEIHAHIFSGEDHGPLFGYTNNMAVRREIFDRCGPFLQTARGADSVFVDRVVRTFSHKVLRYARASQYPPPRAQQRTALATQEVYLRKKLSAPSQGTPEPSRSDAGRAQRDIQSNHRERRLFLGAGCAAVRATERPGA